MDDLEELTELEQAWVHLLQRVLDECIAPHMLATPDGEAVPALIDLERGEVLAFLCIPPKTFKTQKVN